jgi:hypothetical protein
MAKTYRVMIVAEDKVKMENGNMTVSTVDVAFSDLLRLERKAGKSEKNSSIVVNRAFTGGKVWLKGENGDDVRCQLGVNATEISK